MRQIGPIHGQGVDRRRIDAVGAHAGLDVALGKVARAAPPRAAGAAGLFHVAVGRGLRVPDERRGERLVVLHTPLNLSVDELLSRLRETAIPKLWVPRKDNFFEIDALPTLGSGKLDLCRVKELALSLAAQRSKEVLALESRR